jgi:predicted component of type VI protein secretion system
MVDALRDLAVVRHPALSAVLEVRTSSGEIRQVMVDGDGFLIGRGDFCDLQLEDRSQPLVHSELHLQGQAIWIEAADDNDAVVVNGDRCRRMALRDGDRIACGSTEIVVHIRTHANTLALEPAARSAEDLSLLSASELCDRIAQEETAVAAYECRQLAGWQSLLQSVEATLLDDPQSVRHPRLESTIAELRSLSDLITARTQRLAEQEAQFAGAAQDDAQSAIARRIDQMLQGFADQDLRASA